MSAAGSRAADARSGRGAGSRSGPGSAPRSSGRWGSLALFLAIGLACAVAISLVFRLSGTDAPIVGLVALACAIALGSWLMRVDLERDDPFAPFPVDLHADDPVPYAGDPHVRRLEQMLRAGQPQESGSGRRVMIELASIARTLPPDAAARLPSDLREAITALSREEPIPGIPRRRVQDWLIALAEASAAAPRAEPPSTGPAPASGSASSSGPAPASDAPPSGPASPPTATFPPTAHPSPKDHR